MDRYGLFSPISEFSEEHSFIKDDLELEDDEEMDDNEILETNETLLTSFSGPFPRRQSPLGMPDALRSSETSPHKWSKTFQGPEPTPDRQKGELSKTDGKIQFGFRASSDKTGTGKGSSDAGSTSGTSRIPCGICLEDQQLPKLLPCMHSFCRHCLHQHINSNANRGMFKCPLCRREIREPENGANGFEDNIYYNAVSKQHAKCQACTEKEGTTNCLECRQQYCHSCARIHLNMETSKGHHLSAIDREGLESNLTPKLFCKSHRNKKLSYYCQDCGVVVCGKCVIESHKRHNCADIATVAHSYRNELRGHLESSDMGWGFVSTLEERFLQIQRAKSSLQNDVAEESLKIENHAEKLKEKIDKVTRMMVDSLIDREKHLVSQYEQSIDVSETKLKWARNTLQTISQIVDVSGDAEFVSRYQNMREVLGDIKERVTMTPYDLHDVKYVRATPSVQDLVRTLGTIEITGPMRLNLITVFEFPLPTLEPPPIVAICAVSDTESWVFYGKYVQIVDKQGYRGKPIEIEDDVIDATVFTAKTVVIACRRRLLCLTVDRIQDELFPLPGRPNGVAVIQENIIVVFKDSTNISVYSIDGKYLRDINKASGANVMKQPCKIAANDKQEIFVSDSVTKQIAAFDVMGSFITVFEISNILPRILQFDNHGNNLVVADEDENVHLFSRDGQYLQTVIPPRQEKIGTINSIGIDHAGDFWIGNKAGKVHVFYSQHSV